MTFQHLNSLFLLYIHKYLTDSLDLVSVAKEFVSVNTMSKLFISNFAVYFIKILVLLSTKSYY